MVPMARRLLSLAAVLSLLLSAATVALWVRSYPMLDYWAAWRFRWYAVYSCRGAVWLEMERQSKYTETEYGEKTSRSLGLSSRWRFAYGESGDTEYALGAPFQLRLGEESKLGEVLGDGSDWDRDNLMPHATVVTRRSYVQFPHWCAASLCLVLPVIQARSSLRRRRRISRGLCGRCGYDLRASPNRCPECGTPARPLATAHADPQTPRVKG